MSWVQIPSGPFLPKLYIYSKTYILMTIVIKRGGRKEGFSPSKIRMSVGNAAKDAGVPFFKRLGLVMKVAGPVIRTCRRRKVIRAAAIRTMVVSRLQKKSKPVAAAWRKYESRHRRKR